MGAAVSRLFGQPAAGVAGGICGWLCYTRAWPQPVASWLRRSGIPGCIGNVSADGAGIGAGIEVAPGATPGHVTSDVEVPDHTWDRRLAELTRPAALVLDDFAMRELTAAQADDLYDYADSAIMPTWSLVLGV